MLELTALFKGDELATDGLVLFAELFTNDFTLGLHVLGGIVHDYRPQIVHLLLVAYSDLFDFFLEPSLDLL